VVAKAELLAKKGMKIAVVHGREARKYAARDNTQSQAKKLYATCVIWSGAITT
jgi:hypothetical protein